MDKASRQRKRRSDIPRWFGSDQSFALSHRNTWKSNQTHLTLGLRYAGDTGRTTPISVPTPALNVFNEQFYSGVGIGKSAQFQFCSATRFAGIRAVTKDGRSAGVASSLLRTPSGTIFLFDSSSRHAARIFPRDYRSVFGEASCNPCLSPAALIRPHLWAADWKRQLTRLLSSRMSTGTTRRRAQRITRAMSGDEPYGIGYPMKPA